MEWRLFADLAERAGERRVPVGAGPGETVGDALDALLADRPDLRERVVDDDGDLRPEVNLLRNGDAVDLETELEAGDELALFPPVSGG